METTHNGSESLGDARWKSGTKGRHPAFVVRRFVIGDFVAGTFKVSISFCFVNFWCVNVKILPFLT
jgi:hypothetical protein